MNCPVCHMEGSIDVRVRGKTRADLEAEVVGQDCPCTLSYEHRVTLEERAIEEHCDPQNDGRGDYERDYRGDR